VWNIVYNVIRRRRCGTTLRFNRSRGDARHIALVPCPRPRHPFPGRPASRLLTQLTRRESNARYLIRSDEPVLASHQNERHTDGHGDGGSVVVGNAISRRNHFLIRNKKWRLGGAWQQVIFSVSYALRRSRCQI